MNQWHTRLPVSALASAAPLALTVCSLVAALSSASVAWADQQRWAPPIGDQLEISAAYDLPHGPYRAGHRGIDLPITSGTRIRAPTSGTITFAGMVAGKPVVSVRVGPDTVVSFEPLTTIAEVGDRVTRGTYLGEVSTGGHCATTCLHLGVRVDGEYVNPLRYFWARPMLLPW